MFLQEFGERWVDVDGIRTRYFEAGTGRTIVLVHGGTKGDASGGANAEDFNLNFEELSKRFRVISVDRLGQGYTDNPKRDEDWTMGAAVSHLAGFLKAVGHAPYNLVGHSRGGYVVGRVTLDYPRLVESCVMIDSNTASPGPGRNEIVFALNPHKPGTLESSRWTYEKYSCTTQHVTDAWIAMKQKITVLPKNQEAIRKMKEEGFLHTRFLPELLEDKDEFFVRLEKDGMLRPILLFWGYNDPTAPLDLGLELYDLIAKKQPRTSLHIVNQAGHHSFRERAAEFNRVVTEFVEGVAHGN
jgi:2-hydroxy-6-oxonona-2,4-dienedioate hydrolase